MRKLAVAIWMFAALSPPLLSMPAGAATESVLYSFCSQQYCQDGQYPWAGVVQVGDELYATTTIGGPGNNGTLVAVNWRTGAARVAYLFENHYGDARDAEADLIARNGTLYGTSADGGLGDGGNGAGTIYSLRANIREINNVKVLYSFCSEQNCADGALPISRLLHANGLLYGTTVVGGGGVAGCFGPYPGCGTVFSLDPATGTEKVLYRFCAEQQCADGSRPVGNLIALNGILYGTASAGGSGVGCSDMGLGCGAVFAVDPVSGVESVLHTFAGGTDGGAPAAGLTNVNGILYGTTQMGGSSSPCGNGDGCGTVFSIDPSTGTETVLHVFRNNGKDGQTPTSDLIEMNGKLYGTTRGGGAHGYGTVFSYDLSTGKEKVVYSFCDIERCNDGASPYAGLIKVHGTLYGTTEGGGTGDPNFAIGGGTVFSITP
jgi:uncharacterized repeat protein (TIGR03803 family)